MDSRKRIGSSGLGFPGHHSHNPDDVLQAFPNKKDPLACDGVSQSCM